MQVVGVTSKYIAIQKDDDTLVLVPVIKEKQEIAIDLKKLVYLSVKDNSISARYYGGCEITDF